MTQGYYDRDKTVAIITSFYQLLTTLSSISTSDIAYPSPGGWPDISPESHTALKKNYDVIDLYKHLPYLNKHHEISYFTHACDWRYESVKSRLEAGDVVEGAIGPLPDHIAVLTDGNKYGSCLLLDTQNGTITDFRKQEHPERKQPTVGSFDDWKAYPTIPTSIFFESWKEKFRTREFLVIQGNEDDGLLIGWDDPLREMHLDHRSQTNKPQFKALYDFTAQEDNEVTLKEDEILSFFQKGDSGWSFAQTASGSIGWVPSDYVEEIKIEPPAPPRIIKLTRNPPPPQNKTISQDQSQGKLQARANEKKERAKKVAEEEKEATWLYDMMDQIFEMKLSKLEKNGKIEMKEFLVKVGTKTPKKAKKEFAAYMELDEKQMTVPKILMFEDWLNQWLKLKQGSEPSCSPEPDSASNIKTAELNAYMGDDMLFLERELAEEEGETPWEDMEISVIKAKVRREAEISGQMLVSEMEAAEEEIHNTKEWEDEEWLQKPAWQDKMLCIETFGGEEGYDR